MNSQLIFFLASGGQDIWRKIYCISCSEWYTIFLSQSEYLLERRLVIGQSKSCIPLITVVYNFLLTNGFLLWYTAFE